MALGLEIVLISLDDIPTAVFPLADAYPFLVSEDSADLATDIDSKGLLNPIILFADQLLDGRNRMKAIDQANEARRKRDEPEITTVPVRYFEGTDEEAEDLVIGLNEKRRDLTVGQKGVIADRHRAIVEDRARKRQAAAAEFARTGDASLLSLNSGEAGKTSQILAEKHGVGSDTIEKIGRIRRASQETMIDPDTGELIPSPRALKALAQLRKIEAGTQTVNGAIQVVFGVKDTPEEVDPPLVKAQKKFNDAEGKIRKAVEDFREVDSSPDRLTFILEHLDALKVYARTKWNEGHG